MKSPKVIPYLPLFLSLAGFIVIWWVLSLFFKPEFFPSPLLVFSEVKSIFVTGIFFKHMGKTLIRIIFGFSFAMILSLFLGILMGKSSYIEKLLEPEILIGLTIPALAWSIISIMWFGLKDTAAIFAIVMLITPMITVNILQGVKNLDKSLIEMGISFRANRKMILKEIIIPQLMPYILAGSRFGLSLAWKVVVIAEMLGLTSGIGYMIAFWFGMFSMKGVLAWTLSFTIIMFIFEYGFLAPLERKWAQWRPRVQI